jgi:hypothetical protein
MNIDKLIYILQLFLIALIPKVATSQYSNILIADQAIKYQNGKLAIETLPGNFQQTNSTALSDIHGNLKIYFDGFNLRDNGGRLILGDSLNSDQILNPKFLPFSPRKIGFICTSNESLLSGLDCHRTFYSHCTYSILEFQDNQWQITHSYEIKDTSILNWSNFNIARLNDSVFQFCLIDPNKPDILSNFLVDLHGFHFAFNARLPIGRIFLDTIRNHPRIKISYGSTITIDHVGDQCVVAVHGSAEFCPRFNSDPVAIPQRTEEIFVIHLNPLTGDFGIPILIYEKSRLFYEANYGDIVEPFVFSPNRKLIYRLSSKTDNLNNRTSNVEQFDILSKQTNIVHTVPFKSPDIGYNALRLVPDGCILIQRDRRSKGKTRCYFDIIGNPNQTKSFKYQTLVDSLNTICYLHNSIPNIYHYLKVKPQINYKCGIAEIKFNNLTDTSSGMNNYFIRVNKSLLDTAILFTSNDVNSHLKSGISGKFPIVIKGWTSYGYSEIWYDTIVVNIPISDSFNAKDSPIIKRATLINNQQTLVEWKSFKHTFLYEIYKENKYYTTTQDTFFIDEFTEEITAPIEYKIKCKDSCGNVTGFSNIGKTIFLSIQELTALTGQFSECAINFNRYQKWTEGIDHYQLEGNFDGNLWQHLAFTKDTTYIDKDYISLQHNQKCYRVTAFSKNGIQSTSNVSCSSYQPIIFIPNAVTLNSDNLNEKFDFTSYGITDIKMEIYNSWGEKIWENKYEKYWSPDQTIPAGVYVWLLTGKSNSKFLSFNGTVSVIK